MRLESIEGFGSVWWSGGPYAFVVGTEHPRVLDAGDVRVAVGALPGYTWTVTFTRHAAR